MTFARMTRYTTYAMMVVGLYALVVAEAVSVAVLAIPLAAMAAVEIPRSRQWLRAIPRAAVNTLSLAVFLLLVFVRLQVQGDLIGAVMDVSIFLQVVKILTGRTNWDQFQVYLLAMMHLMVSTLLTSDTLFVVPFLLFLLLAPWALTLFALRSDLERAHGAASPGRGKAAAADVPPRVAAVLNARGVVSSRQFAATAGLSLVLLVSTLLIFLLFPRVSAGFLFRSASHRSHTTAFSDQVASLKRRSSFAGAIRSSDSCPIILRAVEVHRFM
jgi:hypothetical protein